MPLNLNECDKACLGCVKSYKSKHSLKQGQKFGLKCFGIPKDFIPLRVLNAIGPEEHELARAMLDPVTWAANTIDWHCLDPDGSIWKRKNPNEYYNWLAENPDTDILNNSRYHRPYQADMLRCTSKRKVFRIGRQCLTASSKITLDNGRVVSIKDIELNDSLSSLHEGSSRIYTNQIFNISPLDRYENTYQIKTKFGHVIECTADHDFYVIQKYTDRFHGYSVQDLPKQWLSIDKGLQPGNKIAVAAKVDSFGDQNIGAWASLLGLFLSDGSASYHQSAKFTNTNMDYLLHFENVCKELGTNVSWYTKGNGYDLIITNGRGKVNPVRDKLKELGLCNITGPEKFIPEILFTSPKQEVREFLQWFWAGDGYISTFQRTGRQTYRTEIGTLQESKKLLEDLQQLLYRFGCHSYIKPEGNCFRLVISNKFSINNFLKEIGDIPGKEMACQRAREVVNTLSDKYLHVENDILWDYITEIKPIGKKQVYDIEVTGDHNFIANGIITHNCGKTESLVISILFNMFTKPGVPDDEGFKIVLITPYQAQIDLIFTRIMELIRSNPVTQNSVKRHVKAPIYTLELHNGSIIRGFTAGTKSGGNAEAVRGQHGHMLVFDEADYLSSGDVDAAMSIVTNFPDATVWMSSTPTGKRERFYSTCHSKMWKEYHYPSQVNPLWNQDKEDMFKEQLTEIGYKHEILGEFGEQEEGVFQNVYVQNAKADYAYGDFEYRNTWTYTIGVDWNDTATGTNIVITGFDPQRNKFVLVDRHVVSRDGWTQLAACNKIAELNRLWKPIAIYIDAGFGGTQWEVLRKYGYDSMIDPTKGPTHPDSKLKDIVFKYDFSKKIETRDLFTKQPLQKDAKPFLVESTVRRFEAGDLIFSNKDNILEEQLLGYIIERVTQTGRPVYASGEKGDHALDALMLSIVAFVMEVTPLGKPKYDSHIAFSGKIGERIDALLHEGDTVINNDKKLDIAAQKREKSRPSMSRTETVEKKSLTAPSDLPANHTTRESKVGLWSWPGFGHDAPRPKVRTLTEAENDAKQRLGIGVGRRAGRPNRKNI